MRSLPQRYFRAAVERGLARQRDSDTYDRAELSSGNLDVRVQKMNGQRLNKFFKCKKKTLHARNETKD